MFSRLDCITWTLRTRMFCFGSLIRGASTSAIQLCGNVLKFRVKYSACGLTQLLIYLQRNVWVTWQCDREAES